MTARRTIFTMLVVALLAVPATALADEGTSDRIGGRTVTTDTVTDRDAVTDRSRFEEAKERAIAAIDHRLAVLGTLVEEITTNRFITTQHAGRLRGDIAPAEAHLEALRRKVEAAGTWEELLPLVAQIDDDKVLAVLAPKTAQVITSDTLVAASVKLETFASGLEAAIQRFELAGYDVAEAWRLLEEMTGLIIEGARLAEPVADEVIGLQPEDWPDPARSILTSGRADLEAARDALWKARATGIDIVHFLRTLLDVD